MQPMESMDDLIHSKWNIIVDDLTRKQWNKWMISYATNGINGWSHTMESMENFKPANVTYGRLFHVENESIFSVLNMII